MSMPYYLQEHSPSSDEGEPDLSSAYSLASTAEDVIFEYGRRFPNYRSNATIFPRGDELAQKNEQALHNLNLTLYDDRLFIAPIDRPRNVLDIRCGQLGLWARDMADRYPEAQVTGMDQFTPDTEGRENLTFILQSYTDSIWVLEEVTQIYGKFDLIYIRSLFGSQFDPAALYKLCMDHLEPGGYIEQCEIVPSPSCDDDTGRKDSVMAQICRLIPEMESVTSVTYDLASIVESLIKEAGFVDIQQNTIKAPWSPWPPAGTRDHRIGEVFQGFYETGLQGWILQPLLRKTEFSVEKIDHMVEAAMIEIRQNDMHWWSHAVTVTARKPLNP